MSVRRRAMQLALPIIGMGLLGACSLVQEAGDYCNGQGYSQGTTAFEQCVANREAEAKRYRSGRRGGRGSGAGG